jgi:TRAP-type mannitol/chloroaromatic compound transport system permease small subunit
MDALIRFSILIDKINEKFGLIASWLVLIACLISAGNAMMRYGFNLSSNAWLEIQWYLFGGMVMLGMRTSQMSRRAFAEFIDFVQSVAADRGVALETEAA